MTEKKYYEGEEIFVSRLKVDEIIELCKTRKVTHFKQVGDDEGGIYFVDDDEYPQYYDQLIQRVVPHLLTSHLKYLDLNDNDIDGEDKGGIVLAEGLLKCKSLTYLDLSWSGFGDKGATAVFNSLIASNTPLVTFNFSNNSDANAPEVWSALAKLITKCPTLTSLNIDAHPSMEAVFQALKVNSTLQGLHLRDWEQDISSLVEDCFEENTTIVRGTGPDYAARCILINQLCQQLKSTESERRSIPKQLKTREEIEGYLREVKQNGEQWNAGKLIFLGNGEVGKTALLKAIRAVQEDIKNKSKWFFQRAKDWIVSSRTVGIDQSILILKDDGEIAVWDFGGQLEYAVTHQFFLSNEMAVIIICYDLSQPSDVQRQQLAYWLDFLLSALPVSASSASKSRWKVIIVGTKIDLCVTAPTRGEDFLASWQLKWPDLPIHDKYFAISSRTLAGVNQVLFALEDVFGSIFQQHTLRIPKPYKSLLHSLQSIPERQSMRPLTDLMQHHSNGMDSTRFSLAVKYLHAIGRVLLLKGDLVCTCPKIIPARAAQFISPDDVRMKLVDADRVEILEEDQIGHVLTIHDNARLVEEVKLLEHLCVGFKLGEKSFLFPSLSSRADTIGFSIDPAPHLHLGALKFTAPRGTIFIPGFFYCLIDETKISKRELVAVHSNCIAMSCSGLFVGELLITIEPDAKSIVAMIRATNPDLSFVRNVFVQLTRDHAVQYRSTEQDTLCPTCIDLSYFRAKFPHSEVGTVKPPQRHATEEEQVEFVTFCEPKKHIFEDHSQPQMPSKPVSFNVTICWTHYQSSHDFFLSYRVATEGKKSSSLSTVETEFGLVEVIYHKLAATKKKDGESVFVFWDKKCLNYGQNWENGFLHGIKSSKVIILLVSMKLIEGMAKNAPKQQDSVLVEYECAILQNELHGIPVMPVFAADMTDAGEFIRFDRLKASEMLPDTPHKRKENAQRVIDKLSESLPPFEKKFLGSIKQTVEKLYMMQGISLTKRGEDAKEMTSLVDLAMNTLSWLKVAANK